MAPATLKDVAKRCGVSLATASRALNNRSEVSPVTRAKVLKAAEEMGYVPSSLAKGLWSGETKVIGVLITTIVNPFYANVVSGIEKALKDYGYNILLCSSYEEVDQEWASLTVLLEQRVDGLILAPVQSKPEVVERLQKNNVPFVLVGRSIPGIDTSYVVCDDYKVGLMAGEHLLERGHKRVLFINSSRNYSAELRLKGFTATMQRHGIEIGPEWVKIVTPEKTAKHCLSEALDQGLNPSAVFCFCDCMVLDVLSALKERGLKVPGDIAVMGVDNLSVTEITEPPLTTIDIQNFEMGIRSAEIILRKLQKPGAKHEHIVLQPTLVKRDST
ncbi:MAG: LacI family transcriptional regulator [Firmicutes bacterium]|jgi:LacI family transcriptional regulator|nr:LacI family DNA-binding transcriptional regulator [Bacillota bacterium]NLL89035.1 LacI family transcriptional regulator [Bacillota bacterium]HKM17771.1 LacI family DNA-binding transcriptional regulator [Limnochordia bacterium]